MEKDNELKGVGNHNTAEFWEYDTRLGRRWNLDPVDQISISNYAAFKNSPIRLSDPMGDVPGDGDKTGVTQDQIAKDSKKLETSRSNLLENESSSTGYGSTLPFQTRKDAPDHVEFPNNPIEKSTSNVFTVAKEDNNLFKKVTNANSGYEPQIESMSNTKTATSIKYSSDKKYLTVSTDYTKTVVNFTGNDKSNVEFKSISYSTTTIYSTSSTVTNSCGTLLPAKGRMFLKEVKKTTSAPVVRTGTNVDLKGKLYTRIVAIHLFNRNTQEANMKKLWENHADQSSKLQEQFETEITPIDFKKAK